MPKRRELLLFCQFRSSASSDLGAGVECLVDDGSSDGTLPAAFGRPIGSKILRSHVSFSRNLGKEAALYAEFVHATETCGRWMQTQILPVCILRHENLTLDQMQTWTVDTEN